MSAAVQPTAAEWAEIQRRLDVQYNLVNLDCDGYIVQLTLARVGARKLAITVYVDGWLKARWLGVGSADPTEEGRRFYQERREALWRGEQKKQVRRLFCKAKAEAVYVYRAPYWISARSLRRHLVTNNDRIEWISLEEAEARRARKAESS